MAREIWVYVASRGEIDRPGHLTLEEVVEKVTYHNSELEHDDKGSIAVRLELAIDDTMCGWYRAAMIGGELIRERTTARTAPDVTPEDYWRTIRLLVRELGCLQVYRQAL